jgi:O-antigen ligase
LQEAVGAYTSPWFYLNPVSENFQDWNGRASSFFDHANSLAGYLNLTLPFALGLYLSCTGKWKKIGGALVALAFATLLCTQSLGGLVSFSCVIGLAVLLFARDWKKRVILSVVAFALAITCYFVKGMLNPGHEGAALIFDEADRLLLWGVAWDLFRHSPALGAGWGNYKALYGAYLGGNFPGIPESGLSAHNLYLQLLAETGILGFAAFSLLMYQVWRESWRQWSVAGRGLEQTLAFGALGAMVALLAHGFVDFLFTPQLETLFWIVLALSVANAAVRPKSAYEGPA